jgi:hypothetical protein
MQELRVIRGKWGKLSLDPTSALLLPFKHVLVKIFLIKRVEIYYVCFFISQGNINWISGTTHKSVNSTIYSKNMIEKEKQVDKHNNRNEI